MGNEAVTLKAAVCVGRSQTVTSKVNTLSNDARTLGTSMHVHSTYMLHVHMFLRVKTQGGGFTIIWELDFLFRTA